ncbi:uncharacterized protein EV420DRAFT_1333741, partial [Desarmillaria tabescens]
MFLLTVYSGGGFNINLISIRLLSLHTKIPSEPCLVAAQRRVALGTRVPSFSHMAVQHICTGCFHSGPVKLPRIQHAARTPRLSHRNTDGTCGWFFFSCLSHSIPHTTIQLVACLLHWGLFGTLSVQLYLYYLAFPNDRNFTKYLVYGIYIFEFTQMILVTHDAFAAFGYGFGDIVALTDMHFDWLTVPIMSGTVACVVQVFYAYRIFILSKSRIVPIFVICVSLTSSVGAIITGVYCFQAGSLINLSSSKVSIAVGIWCGASALCDIIIAVCMTYYLMRSKTGFRRTRILVTKLIRLSIETGTVTAVVSLLNLILFFTFPHQTFYTTPALILPTLYVNTVYMVLNSRMRI